MNAKERADRVTTWVAAAALIVGLLSIGAGILNQHADVKACTVQKNTNKAVRGMLDDFLVQNPKVTAAQLRQADNIALARFPLKPC